MRSLASYEVTYMIEDQGQSLKVNVYYFYLGAEDHCSTQHSDTHEQSAWWSLNVALIWRRRAVKAQNSEVYPSYK